MPSIQSTQLLQWHLQQRLWHYSIHTNCWVHHNCHQSFIPSQLLEHHTLYETISHNPKPILVPNLLYETSFLGNRWQLGINFDANSQEITQEYRSPGGHDLPYALLIWMDMGFKVSFKVKDWSSGPKWPSTELLTTLSLRFRNRPLQFF